MRVAHGVVGHLHVPEGMHLTAAPDTAIAVLVGGEILEHRFHRLAVVVGGIFLGNVRVAGNTESVVGVDVPVEHEAIVVRVGDVALELAEWRAARPDVLADLRAIELAIRVLRQRHPEAVRIGTRRHVVAVHVVRVGDPETRHRVVRGKQHILGGLAIRPDGQAVVEVRALSGCGEPGRDAGLGGMALGLDGQVVHELVAVLDAVFQEEAVTDGVVGNVVLDLQVVRAVHRHAAV